MQSLQEVASGIPDPVAVEGDTWPRQLRCGKHFLSSQPVSPLMAPESEVGDVSVGFVGLGNIARLHADEMSAFGATIGGGLDVDQAARESFARDYGVATFTDREELFDVVDAIVVTTPNAYHEEYVVDALDAGLDVLVEKPLAHTLDSAQRIADAAATSDGFVMIGFHNRFREPVQVAAEYRSRGELGDVTHVEADYVRRRGVPGRGSWFTRKEVAGGGAVVDIGTHVIDLALYLAGYPEVIEVSATTRDEFGPAAEYTYLDMWGQDYGAGEFNVDDSASAFVRCANGTTLSIEVAWATNRPPSQQYFVRGTEAGAGLDLNDGSLEFYETSPVGSPHHRTTEITTNNTDPHQREERYFLECIIGQQSPTMNTVSQGLEVQRVMDGIYRSSEKGSSVRIK